MLTQEGEIDYVCTPHHSMFGMLMVGPALDDAASDGGPRTLGAVPPLVVSGFLVVLLLGLLTSAQLRRRRRV